MTPTLIFFAVLVSIVVVVAVMVLALIHTLFEQRASKGTKNKPLVTTTGPNRHNQSETPPEAAAGRTAA
jgi:hypothetical protein